MTNYFYERSNFELFKTNISYYDILKKNSDEFDIWANQLREEVLSQWDMTDTPPVIGKTEANIIKSFKKLKNNNCDFISADDSDDESLGIIKNFNKDASACNQFFPTMLKTKISVGKSASGGLSIYDHFSLPELKDKFIRTMRRAIKGDSMYSYSRSIVNKKDENPFWDGESGYELIKKIKDDNILSGKWNDIGIWIAKVKESNIDNYGTINSAFIGHGNLYLSAQEIIKLKEDGYLTDVMLTNITTEIEDEAELSSGKIQKYFYLIRWFKKSTPVFPKVLQIFRLSCGQPAVNFPALTAKWIYEYYTNHIPAEEVVNIYDSSSGWGGRILGAMSARRNIHYIGTDPNTDNFISELDISRYEYLAKYYNDKCLNDYSESQLTFFEPEIKQNSYELFQDGSELIHTNPKFKKYENKLDLAFTSPPYFNREQYSEDETQSFMAYSEYDDWRDNFLKPTLTTIYNNLKNDRFILWNIASIKIGKNTYFDLEGDSKKILTELGCEYKGKLKMLMTRMVGLDPSKTGVANSVKFKDKIYKYEPIFVFYKGI
jgi:hypothetical protein